MKIKINGYKTTIEEEVRVLARKAGVKIKDIGDCTITPVSWGNDSIGVSLSISAKDGKWVTNCAM